MVPSDPFMSHRATQLGYYAVQGVSGFATDFPCDVWCRGSNISLLHVGPPLRNRFLNTSWAVGLTYWIVYHHFFCTLTYAIIYCLIHHIIFGLIFASSIFFIFSSTPVLTSSIDVVFVLSILHDEMDCNQGYKDYTSGMKNKSGLNAEIPSAA